MLKMPPRKKRLVKAAQAAGLNVPLTVIQRLVDELTREDSDSDEDDVPVASSSKRTAQHVLEYCSGITTPFGNLMQQWMLPGKNGADIVWDVFQPFAMLWALCVKVPQFASFLYMHLNGIESRIVFWTDETSCGNKMRPDNRRRFIAVYFSWVDLPEYWRSCDYGWLPVGFLSYDTMRLVKSEVSGIMRVVICIASREHANTGRCGGCLNRQCIVDSTRHILQMLRLSISYVCPVDASR